MNYSVYVALFCVILALTFTGGSAGTSPEVRIRPVELTTDIRTEIPVELSCLVFMPNPNSTPLFSPLRARLGSLRRAVRMA